MKVILAIVPVILPFDLWLPHKCQWSLMGRISTPSPAEELAFHLPSFCRGKAKQDRICTHEATGLDEQSSPHNTIKQQQHQFTTTIRMNSHHR
jgi:hypothetical protein